MTTTGPVVGVFDGPGEVRELLREMDWSASPLGPLPSWSPVLRTMVGVCLSSGIPMVIHWGPTHIAVYNDAFGRLLGGKHPAALGRAARETWPEAWDRLGSQMEQVTGHGMTLQADDEQQIMHRNGYPEECYFSYSHSPIIDIDGTTAGMLTVTIETTATVLYERRMRVVRQLGALSVAEAGSMVDTCRAALRVLQTARQSLPFAVAYLSEGGAFPRRVAEYGLVPGAQISGLTDVNGVIGRVIASARPEEVTGLRDPRTGDLHPGPLGPLTPDQAMVIPLTVSGRPEPVGALVVGVNPYRPLDEDYRVFISLIGRQIRVALTDTLAYESERHRVQVLADLDGAKMEFFQNISHELRTPLTLLLAPLQDLLAASGNRSGPAREDLRAAVTAAERLSSMVDALLDYSGAEASTLAPDRQPTDVAAATAEVASMFRSTAEHAGLRFGVQIPTAPVTAMVDRAMWSTIVTNLLSNAVKYTVHGGIDVELWATGTEVVLAVTDTGPGIDPEEQARVFDRFYRAQDGQPDRGAGIGLALVADLIRAHHGHVDLDSAPGRGSTFTVHVPLGESAAIGDQPDQPEVAEGPTPRALLVEDDADLRSYLTRLLTRDGWAVQAAPDAETALTAMTEKSSVLPDLVLTDLMLPGRSGLHLVGEMRRADRTSRLPVIILTARGGPDAAAEGLAAGADDYITKPFSSRELLARVRANHELHQMREHAIGAAEGHERQIRGALDSNRIIGTAVGIVMASYQLTAHQGFRLLVAASQNTNSKLRDIANSVVETGSLPFRPTMIDDLIIRVGESSS